MGACGVFKGWFLCSHSLSFIAGFLWCLKCLTWTHNVDSLWLKPMCWCGQHVDCDQLTNGGFSLGSSRSSRMALKRSWQYKVWLWHVFFQCFLQPVMTWFCQMNLLIISLFHISEVDCDNFNLDICTCALLKSLLVSCRIVTCIWLFWKWCSRASILLFYIFLFFYKQLHIKSVLYICWLCKVSVLK